ncbi:MAG: DUF3566 domain-containing protein [Verrucomicrobiota bacterium]|nr:DUF3566 domain-containing protein [Verrucomicrobiota bacterium]
MENDKLSGGSVLRRIKRISPLQAGKMLGVLHACMGLIFVPFFALMGLLGAVAQNAQHAQQSGGPPAAVFGGMMFGFALLMPVFYGIMGFVGGIIGAAVYNLIARWIGGIEVEVE